MKFDGRDNSLVFVAETGFFGCPAGLNLRTKFFLSIVKGEFN